MGCFYDYKKVLVLITQQVASELLLTYFPKGKKKKKKMKFGQNSGLLKGDPDVGVCSFCPILDSPKM